MGYLRDILVDYDRRNRLLRSILVNAHGYTENRKMIFTKVCEGRKAATKQRFAGKTFWSGKESSISVGNLNLCRKATPKQLNMIIS